MYCYIVDNSCICRSLWTVYCPMHDKMGKLLFDVTPSAPLLRNISALFLIDQIQDLLGNVQRFVTVKKEHIHKGSLMNISVNF
uniref:Uncharacterized protein n=1 Tax=Triticum urartu TaxID=4572 RepID=A0A8R7TCR6_TRIUA